MYQFEEVTKDEGLAFAKELNAIYKRTSAKVDQGGLGIRICFEQDTNTFRVVFFLLVLNHDVANQSTHLMGGLQVATDVDIAFEAYNEGIVYQAQSEEVDFGKVSTEFAFQAMGVEQGIDTYRAIQQLIVPCYTGLSSAIV